MNPRRTIPAIQSTVNIILSALLVAWLVTACIERKPDPIVRKLSPVSAQLIQIVTQQEELLADPNVTPSEKNETLEGFRGEVYALVSQALIKEPEDLYRAALILQHADRTGSAESCLLAHNLALQAVKKGYDEARYLAAACLDRYLASLGRYQRFGTQHFIDSLGNYKLLPINPATTDSERFEWGVPSLEQLQAGSTGKQKL